MEKRRHQKFINGIVHGWKGQCRCLKALQKASDFKAKIPNQFLFSEEAEYLKEAFGISNTKREVKDLRKELITEIVDVILNQETTEYGEEMLPDNYSRLFHALTILKLEKETELLPGTTDNYMYNAAYVLWRLDDGSEVAKDAIESAMWFMSEEIKGRSGMTKRSCIIGVKC